jgi:hypothetical protein
MGFSSAIKAAIPQMLASGKVKKVDTPVPAPRGGLFPMVPTQAREVGPLQGSAIAVATPGGGPAVVQGGGFNSGLMSLLADPAILERLNLSTPTPNVEPVAQEPVTEAPVQNTVSQQFLSSPEYLTAYDSYLNRLSNPQPVISPYQAFVNARMEREQLGNRPYVNPFRRPA